MTLDDAPTPRCTQICATLHAENATEAAQQLAQAASDGADLAELRLDCLGLQTSDESQAALRQLIAVSTLPIIAACRPTAQGGDFQGDEEQRLDLLRSAAQLGAEYVDIELEAAGAFLAAGNQLPQGTGVIVSAQLDATPGDEELRAVMGRLRAAGGNVARLVTTAGDISDSLRVLALLREDAGPTIALALGERGLPTRVLAPKHGAFLIYGALQDGIPGEPSVAQLVNHYHLPQQTPSTKVFGIAGTNVSPDRNYVAQNAAYAAAGVDAVYMPYRVDDFPSFLRAFSDSPDFAGFSVTMPFKGQALALANEKDPIAQRIGASNTLVRQPGGGWKALNTDWVGATSALKTGLGGSGDDKAMLQGKSVLVVGAGGAGQAVAFAAVEAGAAKVYVADVATEKAQQLADSLGSNVSTVAMDDVNAGRVPADVLANGSPIGMSPKVDAMAVTEEAILKASLVFDAIYTPPKTKLLQVAEQRGIATASGFDMFVGQAAYQFQLFTGKTDSVADLMREAVLPTL